MPIYGEYSWINFFRVAAWLVFFLSALFVEAQTTFYWDPNRDSGGTGGTGTWHTSSDSSTRYWRSGSSSGTLSEWSNSNPTDYAVFGGTGGTVSWAADISVRRITFEANNYVLQRSSGTLTLVNDGWIDTGSHNATISGPIAGTDGLTKSGSGTLFLSGANTYTGTTTINGGILQANASNVIASSSNLTIGASGTFQFNWGGFSQTVGALSGSGTLSIRGSNFTTSTSANSEFSGTITDSYGVFRKAGTGDLKLSGNSTYTGLTYIDAGTLIVASNTALGGSTYGNVIANGATLALEGGASGITLNESSFTVQGTGDDGVGAIYNISGDNSLNATLNLSGATTIGSLDGTLSLGNFKLDSNITFSGAGNFASSGQITGTGTLIKNGAGTLTLSGASANSYGATNLNDGTIVLNKTDGTSAVGHGALTIGDGSGAAGSAVIRLDASNQIVDHAPSITFNSDGRLDLNGLSETLNVIAGTGQIHLGGGDLTLGVNSGSSTFGGVISGGGTLTKVGSGTLTLSGANNYTADTVLSSGTLRAGAANTFSSASAVTLANTSGTTLNLNNFNQTIGSLAGGGSTGGNVSLGSATLTTGGDASSTSFGGVISGSGALTKSGAGTLTLSGANTYTGTTTINAGTLQIGDGGTTGSIASSSIVNNGALAFDRSNALSYSGAISGSGSLTKSGAGTLTLSGVNSFTGAIHVQGGTVQVTANDALQAYQPENGGIGNAVEIDTGATFAVSGGGNKTNTIGSVTGTGTVSIAASTILKVDNQSANTFDGTLTGSGLFEKIGSAEFTFSSTANTSAFNFDGTVQLSAGQMTFQGGTSTNALFIDELKTLAGTTLFLNESFINIGTLNITGDTILDFGTGAASVLNASNIYIAAGATLTVRNWSSEVDFLFATNANYAGGGGFRLNNSAGTLADFNQIGATPGNQVHFEGDPDSPDGTQTTWINYDYQGYTNWEIRPIPEPSTYGAILLGACLALFAFHRFRQKKSA